MPRPAVNIPDRRRRQLQAWGAQLRQQSERCVEQPAAHSLPADTPPYRWEFTEKGRDFSVAVPARALSTDSAMNRRLAVAGLGLTVAYEEHVRAEIERGELVRVLEKF